MMNSSLAIRNLQSGKFDFRVEQVESKADFGPSNLHSRTD